MLRTLVSFAALAVIIVACSGSTNQQLTCSGKDCTCAGGTCDTTCSTGSCSYKCESGADCTFHCPGGSCSADCSGAHSCTMDCSGGSCSCSGPCTCTSGC